MRAPITVVSGLPRSGTSLVMQVLKAGGMPILTDSVRVADEDNPRGYFEFEPAKRLASDSSWLEQAQGKVVKLVYALLDNLPSVYKYRVIIVRRPIEEVLASQRQMLTRLGKDMGKLDDAQLGRIFETELARIEQWLAGQSNFSLLSLDYCELVTDPQPALERTQRFLGAPLDLAAMRQAIDPSLYRQRR